MKIRFGRLYEGYSLEDMLSQVNILKKRLQTNTYYERIDYPTILRSKPAWIRKFRMEDRMRLERLEKQIRDRLKHYEHNSMETKNDKSKDN